MNLDFFLTIALVAACCGFIWLDIRGISLSGLVRRALLARRMQRNLGCRFRRAWSITGGRRC